MRNRRWVFPASLCVLAAYALLYAGAGEAWIGPRRLALSPQLSANLTGLTPKLFAAALILAITALIGRWHCLLVCPAGITQELFSRLGGALGLRKLRHASAPSRALLLGVIGLASLFGLRGAAQITDPAGLFGRLVSPLLHVSGFAGELPAAGSVLVWAVIFAGAALLVVLPLFRGRVFCDRFCPVGALLGVASCAGGRQRFAIRESACVSCGRCAAVCPVQCADPAKKTIDPLRCIDCGACARACAVGAAGARGAGGDEGNGTANAGGARGRRSFLGSALAGAAGVFALSKPASALLAADAPSPHITPPGTGGDTRHRQFCIGCGACAAACPAHILRLGAGSGLRPVVNYDYGFCHYNCSLCLDSCPAHAFLPHLSPEERQRTRVARVRLELPRCVVLVNGTACGACGEVCPTHAVRMAQGPDGGQPLPDFDASHCIGCGACYHACPAEPRAFVIEGLAKHETSSGLRPSAAPADEAGTAPRPPPSPGELTDFPF